MQCKRFRVKFKRKLDGNGLTGGASHRRCKAHLVAVRLSNDRLNHRRRDAEFRAPKPKCVISPPVTPRSHRGATKSCGRCGSQSSIEFHRVPHVTCSFPSHDAISSAVWNQFFPRIAHIAGVLRSLIPDADQLMQATVTRFAKQILIQYHCF